MRPPPAPLLLVLAFLSVPATVSAQDPASAGGEESVNERSPLLAGVLDFFVPTAGYAYAGDWKRGLPSGAVRLVGIALSVEQIAASPWGGAADCAARCVIGQVLVIGGTLWAVIDAPATARRANARARERALRVGFAPSPSGGVTLAGRFAVPF